MTSILVEIRPHLPHLRFLDVTASVQNVRYLVSSKVCLNSCGRGEVGRLQH